MALVSRARIAGILAICLLMLGAPGALAGIPGFQPDAQIRPGSNPSYLGVGFWNTSGAEQHAFNSGVVGQKLTFFIKIVNAGENFDSYKVKRSAGFTNGYRVRYYDVENNDVTGQVTNGTFTTSTLGTGGLYVMRATVKVRSLATACSFTSRLITVSSVNAPAAKDAVRFTAALATPELNCPPVAVNDTASITENTFSVSGNLFANDIDPDGDPLELEDFTVLAPAYHDAFVVGTFTGNYGYALNNANLAVNALNNGETLTQVIQYWVNDGNGGVSNTATLTITIHGVTDPD